MTFEAKDLCRQLGVATERLDGWIEAGCVRPRRTRGNVAFSATDRARIELILDLSGSMGVNDDGVAIILDLLDQIYGLRRALKGMTAVVSAQPASVGQHRRSEARKEPAVERPGLAGTPGSAE